MNLLVPVLVSLAVAQAPPSPPPTPSAQRTTTTPKPGAAPTRPKAATPPRAALPSAKKPQTREPRPKGTKKASQPLQAGRNAPQSCRTIVDELAGYLDGALSPLINEVRKRDDSNLDRGQAAFDAALDANRENILAARRNATALQATLSEADQKSCDGYAFTAFHRVLTRFSAAASVYQDRPEIFRKVGNLFR